jgi:hypothetical protein
MRRLLPIVATTLIASVLVGSTAFVGTAGPGEETFTVVTMILKAQEIDADPPGESAGDSIVFKDAVWNEAETQRIGSDWVECTFDFGTVAICTVAFKISGRGQLTGTGLTDLSRQSFSFPITGGTGDFRHATGDARVTFRSGGDVADIEFHLRGTTR